MNHIYIGVCLILFGLFLVYLFLSELLIIAVFCVILAGLLSKDDFTIFRYVATHVASFYLWICDICYNIQNMYHQSNNKNFPARKCVQNNGIASTKVDGLRHRLKTNMNHNLNTSYTTEPLPLSPSSWNCRSNISTTPSYSLSSPQSTIQEISNLHINPTSKRKEKMEHSVTAVSSMLQSDSPSIARSKISPMCSISSVSPHINSSLVDRRPALDAKLFANVNSPGFCSRVADGLLEAMTHQPKYDAVGAFPVVHLSSQSPKTTIKPTVRVRLAPPSNDLSYSSFNTSPVTRSTLAGSEESMKSVLQVLKEISRKRIHSHVDEDCEENSKRSRISEVPYEGEGVLHSSLLQQTIQGKRAREESSPNEEDAKKRRTNLQNNEILSSLSSSMTIKPPHLKSAKRKAQEDAVTPMRVVGKLSKLQTEITPPPPVVTSAPTTPIIQECKDKSPTLINRALPVTAVASVEPTPLKAVEPVIAASVVVDSPQSKEDETVSRLLGRMSDQVEQTAQPIPVVKKNVFSTVNDLSLSPPKENRLAAMIAVLGGPSEDLDAGSIQEDVKQPERNIKGKALFTSPATPDTPKLGKKVTFCESLTTTKIFDRDDDKSSSKGVTVISHSTPLTSLTYGVSSSPTTSDNKLSLGPSAKPVTLNFGSSPFSSGNGEHGKQGGESNISHNANVIGTGVPSAVSEQNQMLSQQTLGSSITVPSPVNNPSLTAASASSNSSLTGVENNKSIFSFGSTSSSPLQNPIGSASKPLLPSANPIAAKPFSFGSGGKTSPNVENEVINSTSKSEVANTTDQKKQGFSIFGNKSSAISSSGVENNAPNQSLVNGFATTTNTNNSSQFAFTTTDTNAASIKPTFPTFDATNRNNISQAPTVGLGSSSLFSKNSAVGSLTTENTASAGLSTTSPPQIFSSNLTSTTSQATTASNLSTNEPNKSGSIFSNAANNLTQTKPNPFGSTTQTSLQGSSGFGEGISVGNVFKPISTTQSRSLFGSNSTNTTPIPNAFSASGTTSSQSTNQMFGFPTTKAPQVNNSPFGEIANSTPSQSTKMFGNPSTTASSATTFGNESSTTGAKNNTTNPTTSVTLGQSSIFSSSINKQPSNTLFSSPATTTSAFGGVTNTTTPVFGNQISSSVFGSQNNTAPSTAFGSQSTTASAAFGSQNNTASSTFGNQNSTAPPAFGSQNNAASSAFGSQNSTASPAFGSQNSTALPAFGSQNSTAPPAFGSQNSTAPPAFGSQNSTAPPAFGSQNSAAPPTFGSQNSTAPPPFGSQNSTAPSAFGNQNNCAPSAFVAPNNSNTTNSFGNQLNTSNTSQSGFATSSTFTNTSAFNIGSNSLGKNEVKPPAFTSSSPFVFGNSSANKEPVKAFGSSGPFSFSSNTQSNNTSVTGLSQPSVPTFGATNTGFGTSQQPQQTPTFGSTALQPSAPAFQFGQTSSAPAPMFQFNAAGPQPGQVGGMFSIGSGSSTARSKAGALRRRHKPT